MNFAEGPSEERIFEAAIALDPSERDAFILQAVNHDRSLLDKVRELLEGYEESGGDDALDTGGSHKARQRWAVSSEEPGAVIDHFRLVRCLGEGGMGTVWEADQLKPVERKVALKVIKLGMDTREVVQRFERERQTLALMNHPHIAQVYEAGATALGRPYFAMELVEGEPISHYCQSTGLSIRERLQLFKDVCAATEHAHQKGIIHRDLKPSNILVDDGNVKVIDFGVAKATQGSGPEATLLTKDSQVLGTPTYMSPEQAMSGGDDVDTRSDVYSLGVVLYELLSGKPPFDPERLRTTSAAELQRIITEEEPPLPSRAIGSPPSKAISRELDGIVMKALAKERERRYPSASAFAEDVRRYLDGEAVSAVPPTKTYQLGKFVRKHRLAVTSLAAIFVAMTIALAVSLIQTHRVQQAKQEVTLTVADLYARKGLEEAEPTTAALWFAQAAVVAQADPDRVDTNQHRAAAWRQAARTAVRAIDTEFDYVTGVSWHPHQTSIIASSTHSKQAQIWDLETSQQWQPEITGSIRLAAWSPNGEHVAICDGNQLTVRSFPSAEVVAEIDTDTVGLAWSPNGQWLALDRPSASLWDWRTKNTVMLPALGSDDERQSSIITFSQDNQFLLLSEQGRLGICRLSNPTMLVYPPIPIANTVVPGFLSDSHLYYAANEDRLLYIGDSDTNETIANLIPLEGTDAAAHPLECSPDGNLLAMVGQPLLDVALGSYLSFPPGGSNVEARTFSPDGSLFVNGGYGNTLSLWDVASGSRLATIGHSNYPILDASFSPDSCWLTSAERGLIRVWQTRVPKLGRELPIASRSLATLSPDGNHLVASGYDNLSGDLRSVQRYHMDTGRLVDPPRELQGQLMEAAYAHDGTWLACAVSTTSDRENAPFTKESGDGGSGHILRIDLETGEALGPPIAMPSEPRGVCVHPSGRFLGVCCAAGEGLEIDLETGEVTQLFDNEEISHPHEFANNGQCAYSPDGRVFVVWGLYKHLHLWDRAASKHLREPSYQASHFPDVDFHGTIISSTEISISSKLEFHDSVSGNLVMPPIPYTNAPWVGRFDETGERFLTGGGDFNAQVWDWRNGSIAGPALSHTNTVTSGQFFDWGSRSYCVTSDVTGAIHFWDYQSGMEMRPPLRRSEEWVLQLLVTADSRHLIASQDGITVFDFDQLLPKPKLSPESALLLAEIDASAEVHPSGGLVPLSAEHWLGKWQQFRQRHPDYPGHQLTPP